MSIKHVYRSEGTLKLIDSLYFFKKWWNLGRNTTTAFIIEGKKRNKNRNEKHFHLLLQNPRLKSWTWRKNILLQTNQSSFYLAGIFIVLHLQFLLHPARCSTVSFFPVIIIGVLSLRPRHSDISICFSFFFAKKGADKKGAEFPFAPSFCILPSFSFSLFCV